MIVLPYWNDKCRITKLYGTPPPAGKKYSTGKHAGIDLVGIDDNCIRPITSRGMVYKTGNDPDGWGKYVVVKIEPEDEERNSYYVIYAHLSHISVQKNDILDYDDIIGNEGATGNVTGAHLHLEIRRNYSDKNSTIDPAEYLGIKNKLGVVEMKEQEQVVSGWAKADWNWAKEQGLLDGTRPKDPVSREELAAILHRLFTMS